MKHYARSAQPVAGRVFISHYVQMKLLPPQPCCLFANDLYIPLRSDETKGDPFRLRMRFNFISHYVQMKLFWNRRRSKTMRRFISHYVQMKLCAHELGHDRLHPFISHYVQMKHISGIFMMDSIILYIPLRSDETSWCRKCLTSR